MEDLQIKKLDGREVSHLSVTEFILFEDACKRNRATRLYEGYDGKAKVKIYASPK
jgi:hypothetical protein